MPYKNDPRRTVTLNLSPKEYALLADDALQAGYASPGTYALALVRTRGEAPDPVPDQRAAERYAQLASQQEWRQTQLEAFLKQVLQAGLQPAWVEVPAGLARPRSRAAQDRAVRRAVAQALATERANVTGAGPPAPPTRP